MRAVVVEEQTAASGEEAVVRQERTPAVVDRMRPARLLSGLVVVQTLEHQGSSKVQDGEEANVWKVRMASIQSVVHARRTMELVVIVESTAIQLVDDDRDAENVGFGNDASENGDHVIDEKESGDHMPRARNPAGAVNVEKMAGMRWPMGSK